VAKSFSATIDIIGVNPFVRPPDEVLDSIFKVAGKAKSPISVRGTIQDVPFQQSLVRYQGDWRLYINNVMAKDAGLRYSGSISAIVGMQVTVSLEYDPRPVVYDMVPEFQEMLTRDKPAKAAYDQLTPGRQKEILRYLGSMKTDSSLQRNISRVMQHLHGEESDGLYALMHRKPRR
jgi:hypothetical protein